jgi:hypothetical protein
MKSGCRDGPLSICDAVYSRCFNPQASEYRESDSWILWRIMAGYFPDSSAELLIQLHFSN